MSNRSPHIVGGGLGTFRKEAKAAHEKRTAEQVARNKRQGIATMHRIAKKEK
jgi:hypothetical protein